MKKTLPLAVAAVLMLTMIPRSHAENIDPLSFSEFLEKVEAHYPALKQQRVRVEQALAERHRAAAGFLPKFTGVSSWTAGDDPVYVFGTLLKQGAFTESDFDVSRLNSPDARSNFSYGVEGRWMLFDAFETVSRTRFAGELAKSEELREDFARMETFLVAIEAFYRAVLQENLSRAAQEVFLISQNDIEEAESLNQKGMVLGADFYAAKVNHGMLERTKNRFERDFQSSKVILNILMGEDPLREIRLGYGIAVSSAQEKGLDAWLQTAFDARMDIAALNAMEQAAKTDIFYQKMSFLPRINAFVRVEENTHSWRGNSGSYMVGLQGQMDLFEPGYGARNEIARLKLKQAIEQKNALKDSAASALAFEYSVYQTVVADKPVAERMLEDAKKASELTEKLYREGKKSVADLLEIRRVYLETGIKAYETRFYDRTSYSRLLYLSGALDRQAALQIGDGLKKS